MNNTFGPIPTRQVMALNANALSSVIDITDYHLVGLQVITAGVTANTGTFTLQRTIDGVTWVTAAAPFLTLAGANTSAILSLVDESAAKLRISFVPGGGGPTGTATVWALAKGRNS